jgi:hypothetical protein
MPNGPAIFFAWIGASATEPWFRTVLRQPSSICVGQFLLLSFFRSAPWLQSQRESDNSIGHEGFGLNMQY